MYKPICPLPDRPGYYAAFETATTEAARQALIDSWTTPEQREFNATHKRCPVCKGRGYAVYKSRGHLIRENMGCICCEGLGVVPNTLSDKVDKRGLKVDNQD